MSGGQNATTQTPVFSTSDVAAARQQMQTIDRTLGGEAVQQLGREAGHLVFAQDHAGKTIDIVVNNPVLPPGCTASTLTPCPIGSPKTLTVSVDALGTAYSPAAAKAAVLQELKSKVPSKSELLSYVQLGPLRVISASAEGTLTLTGRSIVYWGPELALKPLAARVAFTSPAGAKNYLLSRLPRGSTVTVSQSPFGLPWLPFLSGRIKVVRVSI